MGFFTSFLFICILALFSHSLYHKYGLPEGHLAWIYYFSLSVVGTFLIIDALIYLGIFDFIFPLINQIPWVDISNGKDFMWNSFQLIGINFNINHDGPGMGWLALLLFLSYPMWYGFFKNLSKIIFGGSKPYQEGVWYIFKPTKKPKENDHVAKTPRKT